VRCGPWRSATISNEKDLSRYIAIFFIGYCIMDLTIGRAVQLEIYGYKHGMSRRLHVDLLHVRDAL